MQSLKYEAFSVIIKYPIRTMPERESFKASFDRIFRDPHIDWIFADDFYHRLRLNHHEIDEVFRNFPVAHLKAIRVAIITLAKFEETGKHPEFLEILRQHKPGFKGIKPWMMDNYLEELLNTASEFDPLFNYEARKGWESCLRPGIEYFKKKLK